MEEIGRELTRISADKTKREMEKVGGWDIVASPPLNPLPMGGEVKAEPSLTIGLLGRALALA
jgi:hypothetical protein